jgi:GMP synthase PP-ATPase subunit
MGDGRTYDYVVALRAVQTQDFMTAHWAHLPHELLARFPTGLLMKCVASIVLSTIFPANRQQQLSGNKT